MYEYKGKQYQTLRELIKKERIVERHDIIKKRLNRGIPLDEAIKDPFEDLVLEYNGKKYKSFSEMCKDLNKNYMSIRRRISHGYTLKEAIEYERKTHNDSSIVYASRRYRSLEELCFEHGKTLKEVEDILENDFSLAVALSGNLIKYNNKYYSSKNQLAKELGMSVTTLTRWLDLFPLDEAIDRIKNKDGFRIEALGITVNSLKDLCNIYGVSVTKVRELVKDENIYLHDALFLAYGERNNTYHYRGMYYRTLDELCLFLGLKKHNLVNLKRLTLQEKITLLFKKENIIGKESKRE